MRLRAAFAVRLVARHAVDSEFEVQSFGSSRHHVLSSRHDARRWIVLHTNTFHLTIRGALERLLSRPQGHLFPGADPTDWLSELCSWG